MHRAPVVVIGAGQAGLALSHVLTRAGVEHVVLERGRVAQRWAGHPRESLRLLSPNWMSRLPGFHYTGPDPDGFMSAAEVAAYLRSYATASAAPVVENAEVRSVRAHDDAFVVTSTAGGFRAAAVVVATGWCDMPFVPAYAAALDRGVDPLTSATYRCPAGLRSGRVLVVGASATGTQIADELARAGRQVVFAVGSHTRLPRRHRGHDIMWWLDRAGLLDCPIDRHPRPEAARREPSLQLTGSDDGREVDLRSLQDRGVELVGRLSSMEGSVVRFARDLAATTATADEALRRLVCRLDGDASPADLDALVRPVRIADPAEWIDLRRAGIRTVVWATGYRRAYPWLHLPVVDRCGDVRHRGGATPVPGLYVLGMRWQSRRSSSFLDGVRFDAVTVAGRVLRHLGALSEVAG